MDESLKKIESLLTSFNNTFKLKIDKSIEDEITDLSIDKVIGDGKDFINEMVDLFDKVIKNSTDKYELIFMDDEKQLVLARKVPSINYEI